MRSRSVIRKEAADLGKRIKQLCEELHDEDEDDEDEAQLKYLSFSYILLYMLRNFESKDKIFLSKIRT